MERWPLDEGIYYSADGEGLLGSFGAIVHTILAGGRRRRAALRQGRCHWQCELRPQAGPGTHHDPRARLRLSARAR